MKKSTLKSFISIAHILLFVGLGNGLSLNARNHQKMAKALQASLMSNNGATSSSAFNVVCSKFKKVYRSYTPQLIQNNPKMSIALMTMGIGIPVFYFYLRNSFSNSLMYDFSFIQHHDGYLDTKNLEKEEKQVINEIKKNPQEADNEKEDKLLRQKQHDDDLKKFRENECRIKDKNKKKKIELFFDAIGKGDLVIIENLLASGFDINSKTSNGSDGLTKAVLCGFSEVLYYLVEHEAKISTDALASAFEYNIGLYDYMTAMQKFQQSPNGFRLYYESYYPYKISMLKYLINTKKYDDLKSVKNFFSEGNSIVSFCDLLLSCNVKSELVKQVFDENFLEVFESAGKDKSSFIIRQYKKNIEDYFKFVVEIDQIMQDWMKNNRKFKNEDEKNKYESLVKKRNSHKFYSEIDELSKQDLKNLIVFVMQEARKYYKTTQQCKYYMDTFNQVFKKLSKELKRMAKKGGIDLLEYVPKGKPQGSFAKGMLDKYYNISKEELDKKRKYWQSDDFKSLLKKDENCHYILDRGDHLRKFFKDGRVIISFGQSPSYWVLAAELLDLIDKNENTKYLYLAFSGQFCEGMKEFLLKQSNLKQDIVFEGEGYDDAKNFPCDDLSKKIYYDYLKSCDINGKSSIVICEQLEFGLGIKSFFTLKLLPDYELYVNEYGFNFTNKARQFFPDSIDKKISYSFTTNDDKDKELRDLLDELSGVNDERIRLVPSFPKKTWLFADPFDFIPGPEAEDRVLRIIDYMHSKN